MTESSPDDAPSIPSAAAAAAVRDWPRYFDAVADAGPRETLVAAADRFDAEGAVDPVDPPLAIDLGCGSGRDTLELLRRGWRVLALDGETEALRRVRARKDFAAFIDGDRLQLQQQSFEDTTFPTCALITSSYTLPFCPPELFDGLWSGIVAALRPGGRLAGQFFGDLDDWADLPDRTHHTRAQLDTLFDDFTIEQLTTDLYGPNPQSGYPKRWHVHHIVARRTE